MSETPQGAFRWPDGEIVLTAIGLAIALVQWSDKAYVRVIGSPIRLPAVSRPDWVWRLNVPYRRVVHNWPWVGVAATVGAAGLIARDRRTWSRRGLSRPGTVLILVILVVGSVTLMSQACAPPSPNGLCFSLTSALVWRVPGAVVGFWVVAWFRRRRGVSDWRQRLAHLVGWGWVGNLVLTIAYGVLFG